MKRVVVEDYARRFAHVCERCGLENVRLTKHHIHGRWGRNRGESIENFVYVCGSGITGCHGILGHHFGTHAREHMKQPVPKWARIVPGSCDECGHKMYVGLYLDGNLELWCWNGHVAVMTKESAE